jgi:hypothetical protein
MFGVGLSSSYSGRRWARKQTKASQVWRGLALWPELPLSVAHLKTAAEGDAKRCSEVDNGYKK